MATKSENKTVYTLEDGRVITQKPLSGKDYFAFKRTINKTDAAVASQELMLKMFEIDGKPLTIDLLEDPAPEGLGFEVVAALDDIVNSLFLDSQNRSRLSPSAE